MRVGSSVVVGTMLGASFAGESMRMLEGSCVAAAVRIGQVLMVAEGMTLASHCRSDIQHPGWGWQMFAAAEARIGIHCSRRRAMLVAARWVRWGPVHRRTNSQDWWSEDERSLCYC